MAGGIHPIYLDHGALTPVDPEVRAAMLPWLGERFGHPGHTAHRYGWDAEQAFEAARAEVADLLGTTPPAIVFTSGATESDNLAVVGSARALRSRGNHLVACTTSGQGVLAALRALEGEGFRTSLVPCDEAGRVDVAALEAVLEPTTTLVSIEAANPESGAVQDVMAMAALCRSRGVRCHVEATHALAWMALSVGEDLIDLLTLSGETMGAPLGCGALFVRRRKPRANLEPLLHGGGQERGLRSGAPNLIGAIGLGRAATLVRERRESDAARVAGLRDRLAQRLLGEIQGARQIGPNAPRLPHHVAVAISGVEGESLVVAATNVAMGTGSACSSATLESSHVLAAMGLSRAEAVTVVRLTLGRTTAAEEIEAAATSLVGAVARLRTVAGASAGHPL